MLEQLWGSRTNLKTAQHPLHCGVCNGFLKPKSSGIHEAVADPRADFVCFDLMYYLGNVHAKNISFIFLCIFWLYPIQSELTFINVKCFNKTNITLKHQKKPLNSFPVETFRLGSH